MLLQILKILTFVFTVVAGVCLALFIVYEASAHSLVKKLLEESNGKAKLRKTARKVLHAEKYVKFGPFEYLDKLILKSGIHSKFFTPTALIIVSVFLFILSIVLIIQKFAIPEAILMSLFISIFPEIAVYLLGEKKETAMNASYIEFLNLLENFLSIRDDISYAMEQTSKYRKQLPLLSEYCCGYVFDIAHGYTPMDALKKFATKVDNGQIKNLIFTLISCNINSGKYLNVVKQSKNNYLELYDKLIDRQAKAKKGRATIIFMLGIYTVIFVMLNFIISNLFFVLTKTPLGIAMTCLCIISFIITFFVAINVGHFKFN